MIWNQQERENPVFQVQTCQYKHVFVQNTNIMILFFNVYFQSCSYVLQCRLYLRNTSFKESGRLSYSKTVRLSSIEAASMESVFVRLSFFSYDRYVDLTIDVENLGLYNVFKWLFQPIISSSQINTRCRDRELLP